MAAAEADEEGSTAAMIPFAAPLKELEQEPTPREIEVLQLICDGLVNREIGGRLFLSEETVKSPRPPPAGKAAGALARTRSRRRLSPRPYHLAGLGLSTFPPARGSPKGGRLRVSGQPKAAVWMPARPKPTKRSHHKQAAQCGVQAETHA